MPWHRAGRGLAALAALIALANLVVLITQGSSLVHGLYLNADNASALVMPALASHAPAGAVVNMGDHPWYEPWWLMRATIGLPGYRQLWEAAPFLLGMLAIAAVSACAWRALGRLAALLCGAVLLAASESLRGILYVPESHGLIALHIGVLCGALLIVHERSLSGRLTPRTLLALGVALVLFTGAGLTDQLLLVSGLAFILAPVLCWLRFRSRVWMTLSAFAIATGAISVLVALLVAHVMQDQHVVHAAFPIKFVASEAVVSGLQNLIAAFASLGGGSFFGGPASGSNLLTFLAGALTLLALAFILRAFWGWVRSSERPVEELSRELGSRELFLAYWGFVLVLVLGAFAVTSVSDTATDTRYLVGAWVAVAALLGILASAPATRILMLAAVALFGVINLHTELTGVVQAGAIGPDQAVAGAIERFVSSNGASVGYSGYWDGAPVTWETHLRVRMYPIQACGLRTGWCQFSGAQISSWYVPRAHTRTFLLVDTRPYIPLAVTAPPTSFGSPVAQEAVGDGLTVYIYNHDIAADLGH